MKKIEISVIIAVYNAEQYIKQCLDSLLGQTFSDFEIICVDDGSTDSSLTILNEYKKHDQRIQIYTQTNQYAGVARNNGLKYAKGKYSLFLDADDFLREDSLQVLFDSAIKEETDIVVFGHYLYDTEQKCVLPSDYVLEKLEWFEDGVKKPQEIAPYIFNFSEPCAWNKLYRTEFIKKSGICFMSLKSTNDLFFSYMTLALAERICVCKNQLIYYRVNNSKSLQGDNSQISMDFSCALNELKNRLSELHLFKNFKTSFYNLAINSCYYHFCKYKGKCMFREFYDVISQYMTQEIQIEGYIPNEYTDKYVYYQMHKVMNLQCDEYLKFEEEEKQISHPYYYFPFWILPKNKRVVIYGAGNVGKSYYFQLTRMKYCQSLKMTDSAYETLQNEDVCPMEEAFFDECDYVIIAVADIKVKRKIEERLEKLSKGFVMLWLEPMKQKWRNV